MEATVTTRAPDLAGQHLPAAGLLTGRMLLGLVFALAGWHKLGGYAATQAYMEAMGVPGMLLPLVIALELGAGVALMVGYRTRLAALALAVFTLAAALLFHADLADQMQGLLFMKNLGMAGGLLVIAAAGAGHWSVDARARA
jgi:putative oxidoreductase